MTGADPIVFFDGTSNRRLAATLAFTDALEIAVDGETKARWAYADIRRADSAPGNSRWRAGSRSDFPHHKYRRTSSGHPRCRENRRLVAGGRRLDRTGGA